MLPVHDHTARASTLIVSAMDLAKDLGSREANASGWARLPRSTPFHGICHGVAYGLRPRFAA